MGKKVFANGMEIAHKAGDGKVVAAFPDVCLSPPSPPAGPIPLPYPNTSKASDLQEGSKTVLVAEHAVALKDQSFYKVTDQRRRDPRDPVLCIRASRAAAAAVKRWRA